MLYKNLNLANIHNKWKNKTVRERFIFVENLQCNSTYLVDLREHYSGYLILRCFKDFIVYIKFCPVILNLIIILFIEKCIEILYVKICTYPIKEKYWYEIFEQILNLEGCLLNDSRIEPSYCKLSQLRSFLYVCQYLKYKWVISK